MAPNAKSLALSPEEHNLLNSKTIDLVNGSVEQKRAEILEYFHKVCALHDCEVTLTRLPHAMDADERRNNLMCLVTVQTFSVYESLFDVIRDHASYFYQPEKLRHPLIFYYGHTAVFFINKLVLAKVCIYA